MWKKSFKEAITIGFRVGTLYQVGGSPLGAMTCDTNCQTELWHRRFGHLHYKALPEARKVVTGMPEFKNDHEGVCQGYAEGKHTRGPFPSSVTKTSDVLQLIHSDLSGMLPMKSLGGCSYYMTFIDEFSRKPWIYFFGRRRTKHSYGFIPSRPWWKIKEEIRSRF